MLLVREQSAPTSKTPTFTMDFRGTPHDKPRNTMPSSRGITHRIIVNTGSGQGPDGLSSSTKMMAEDSHCVEDEEEGKFLIKIERFDEYEEQGENHEYDGFEDDDMKVEIKEEDLPWKEASDVTRSDQVHCTKRSRQDTTARPTLQEHKDGLVPPHHSAQPLNQGPIQQKGHHLKRRRPNFSQEELITLISGVKKRWRVIDGPLSSVVTSALKQQAWEETTEEINAMSRVQRYVDEVRNKYIDFKSMTKKRILAWKKKTCTDNGLSKSFSLSAAEEAMVHLLRPKHPDAIDSSHEAEPRPASSAGTVFKEEEVASIILVNEDRQCTVLQRNLSTKQPALPQCAPPLPAPPHPAVPDGASPRSATAKPPSPHPAPLQPTHSQETPLHTPPPRPLSTDPKRRQTSSNVSDHSFVPHMLEIQQGILSELRLMRVNMESVMEKMANHMETIANSLAEIAARGKQ